MTDNHLAYAHKYFNLSDYAIDPHSRYRKRIFREGNPLSPVQSVDSDENTDIAVSKCVETEQVKEHVQKESRRRRRRESTTEGYATDDSYADMPPMSPFSSGTSALEGIEDTGEDTHSPNVPDRERMQPSTSVDHTMKGKEPILPPQLPIAVRLLPKIPTVSAKVPNSPSASSSITQYSTNRLAERARLASLPTRTAPPARLQTKSSVRTTASRSISAYSYGSTANGKLSAGQSSSAYDSVLHTDPSNTIRARRATINEPATHSQSSFEPRVAKRKPVDDPVPIAALDTAKVKLERASPPLNLTASERPHSATHVVDLVEDSASATPVAGPSRHHKRSKSSASVTKGEDASNSVELEQSAKRSDKAMGASSKMVLDSGDYDQVTEHSWVCRVHGDNLSGLRSVVRHHESVHLNIMAQCEYCDGSFSRRDAVLRHQRQGGCKMMPRHGFRRSNR